MSSTGTDTPLDRYYRALNDGVRSSASAYARQRQEQVYWQKKSELRYIQDATSASNELEIVVQRTQAATDELSQYKILVAQLARDIYGLQSYTSYLAHITGETYQPTMDDPQLGSADLLQSGKVIAASLSSSLCYLREHIVSTRLILQTNRRAMGHVLNLSRALQPELQLSSIQAQILGNTYQDDVAALVEKFDAAEL